MGFLREGNCLTNSLSSSMILSEKKGQCSVTGQIVLGFRLCPTCQEQHQMLKREICKFELPGLGTVIDRKLNHSVVACGIQRQIYQVGIC